MFRSKVETRATWIQLGVQSGLRMGLEKRGAVQRGPVRAWPPVIVGTEKVLREAGGPAKARGQGRECVDGCKGGRSWVRSHWSPESPKTTSG